MALKFAVFISTPFPTAAPSPDATSPDSGLWSPMPFTLIYTPTSALLIDCPPSSSATHDLAAWVKGTLPQGCTLKYFLTTHGHGDHFFGFPVLQEYFPDVRAVASRYVVQGIHEQYSPQWYESTWKLTFPDTDPATRLPKKRAEFTALPESNVIDLDGDGRAVVRVHDVTQGDTHHASFVHVPELGLVVASDIVYNGDCHQYLGESNTATLRANWIKSVDDILALHPDIVVPGHSFHVPTDKDPQYARAMLEGTKAYVRGFEEELEKAQSADELFGNMRKRYNRWNLYILNIGCAAGFANKAS